MALAGEAEGVATMAVGGVYGVGVWGFGFVVAWLAWSMAGVAAAGSVAPPRGAVGVSAMGSSLAILRSRLSVLASFHPAASPGASISGVRCASGCGVACAGAPGS